MPKEKYQTVEIKNSERIFHYEILGIILIILAMFSIAKLGIVGRYLMLTTKFLFGDWHFLITFLMLAYGIRCIIVHEKLKIGNVRYLGIFLIILSLILLSHFSMHKYVKDFEQSPLKLTISIYFNAFKTESADMIVGGGVIGALLFYLFYFLFSEVGVILMSLILIFLGIVFISKKTIKEFIRMIIHFGQKIYQLFKKTKGKVRRTVDTFDHSYTKSKLKYKIKPVNYDTIYENELRVAKNNVTIITNILHQMNVFYNEISYLVCRNVTIYFISSHYVIPITSFEKYLRSKIEKYLLKYDKVGNALIVEVTNKYQVPLRISEIEMDNKDEVVFGIDDRNEFLKLNYQNNKLLIVGTNAEKISYYLDSIVLGQMYHKSQLDYYYIDLTKKSIFSTSESMESVAEIIGHINDRIKKMNQQGISTFERYNEKNKIKEKGKLVIIHGLDKLVFNDEQLEKVMYMLETTNDYGFIYIFTIIGENEQLARLYNLCTYYLFFDDKLSIVNKMIGYQRFDYLNNDLEAFLFYKNMLLRMSLLLMSKEERESIKK